MADTDTYTLGDTNTSVDMNILGRYGLKPKYIALINYIPSDFGNDSEKILYEDICICDDLVLGLVKTFEQALVIQCVPQW